MSGQGPVRVFSVAIRMWVVCLVVLGVAYPLAVTGIARAAFPAQSRGSLVTASDGTVIGSALIGQSFATDRYFHGRPSAAGDGYDAMSSGGTNLGPTSAVLAGILSDRAGDVSRDCPDLAAASIPADMITASASGLDPDISPANALAQAPRVARARGLGEDEVSLLVRSMIRGRDLGLIGEPRVNVLELNMALDEADTP